MPKQINAGQLTSALQRAFGFKGKYIPMLDEVVVPVYVISDPSPAHVTRLAAGTTDATSSGGALEFPAVQLFNPPESGVVANVTTVVASADLKKELLVSFFDTPLTEVRPFAEFRDRRIPAQPTVQMRRDTTTLVKFGDVVAILQVDGALSQTAAWVADTGDPRQPLCVLGPGQGLVIQFNDATAAAQEAVRANFRWLEVPITQVNPLGGIP